MRLSHRLLCQQLRCSLHVRPPLDKRGRRGGKPTDAEFVESQGHESVGESVALFELDREQLRDMAMWRGELHGARTGVQSAIPLI